MMERTAGSRTEPLAEAWAFPEEMTSQQRWTRSRGKAPWKLHGGYASSTNPTTWSTFEEVTEGERPGVLNEERGFGYMCGDGIGAYDLDHVTDGEARAFIATVTEEILFMERSISGEGVHVFVRMQSEGGWKRRLAVTVDGDLDPHEISVERYPTARFIRTTGVPFTF